MSVAKIFGQNLDSYKIFVSKSTVPVGTCAIVKQVIADHNPKKAKFDVVSNPEFLKEGSAVEDTLRPDRIIIGSDSDQARAIMNQLYEPIVKSANATVLHTSIKNAEIIKYAANAFLATKVSFINELANFCDQIDGDVNIKDIAKGLGLDTRIGSKFLSAGIGYGGSCFPKDIRALIEKGKEVAYNFRIIQEVDRVNEDQKKIPVKKLLKLARNVRGKTIAIWGLAFKPNTDDMRDAPSIEVIYELTKLGAQIKAYDPVSADNAKELFKDLSNVQICSSKDESIKEADALILLTEWNEFKSPDFAQLKEALKGDIVIDGRNLWERDKAEATGLKYACIGR